jgi:DNA repair exonuclease SbcCD ATPase subunit
MFYLRNEKERTMAKAGGKVKTIAKRTAISAKSTPAGATMPDTGSVEKIRDILFGNQMRDFDRRFSMMEERMVKTAQNLREEINKRLEALEQYFREELEALKERLKAESDQRTDADKQQAEMLQSSSESLQKVIAETEEKFAVQTTELRQQILKQSKSLSADIQSKYEQASRELRLTADGLNDAKIERSMLAEYLIEMATGISNYSDETATDPAAK